MKISRCKKLFSTAAALATSIFISSTAFSFGGGGSNPASDYARSGSYTTTSHSGGGSCTIYRPRNLTNNHPVILWGNGTGGSPTTYAAGLHHWASWGFVVAAANTSNSGSGREMLSCLDWLSRSSIQANLDLSKVGASGHSQGGGGTIAAGRDTRVDTTAPMQPYTLSFLGHRSSWNNQQNGPMLLLGSTGDTIASPRSNQLNVFGDANVPIFYAEVQGPSHFESVGDMGSFSGISTAWFLYQLRGDSNAASLFQSTDCGMCDANSWNIRVKGNP